MNTSWNRFIYRLWAPVYDTFFHRGPFRRVRERLFQRVRVAPGSRVLLVGAGTGADLEYLLHIPNIQITAIDLSEAMLREARKKDPTGAVRFLQMDAQQMTFEANTFDTVIGSLVLSVVPDARACFGEMLRVAKPGGQLLVLDKFAPAGRRQPLLQRAVRPLAAVLGTDIGRCFEQVTEPWEGRFRLILDEAMLFGGMYRGIVMEKADAV